MHRSRLVAVIIDCKTEELGPAAEFWSAALGRATYSDPRDTRYIGLVDRPGQPNVMVQRVDHDSRVHLDIETDDIEAEVARLEKLGARRIGNVKKWVVMEAPTGHRFCVLPQQGSEMPADANTWE